MGDLANNILLEGEAVVVLIPQRPPMMMVDKLLDYSEQWVKSGLTIKPDNIFCENGFFTEPGLTEHIAQTAALKAGYGFRKALENGEVSGDGKAPLGFIGSVKGLEILELPKAGCELETELVVEHQVFNASMVRAEVKCEGKVVARAEMKIFLQDI